MMNNGASELKSFEVETYDVTLFIWLLTLSLQFGQLYITSSDNLEKK